MHYRKLMKEFLEKWIKTVLPADLDRYYEIIGEESKIDRISCTVKLYTMNHEYFIYALAQEESEGILECICFKRKCLAGEKSKKSYRIMTGDFSLITWHKIKSGIIANELVQLGSE